MAISLHAQTWYQKEKRFVPFIAGAAAAGNMQMFKDPKSLAGSEIWSAVETGLFNKNTSFGIAFTSYEWTKVNETYFGFVAQRRLLVFGRAETWASAAYGIPFKVQFEKKVQLALRERIHLHKAFALEVSYQKTIAEESDWSFNKHQAFAIGAVIGLHGNVNSNNK